MSPHAITDSFSSRLVALFLRGPLPVLIIAVSLIAGLIALAVTPREEEPQIVVPVADIIIEAPGLGAEQVERQVATRLEKLLAQIDGVEYVYSASRPGACVVTVRFFVGEDREDSLVKIYNKLQSNLDRVPPAVRAWVVKPVEIDDVPIVIASLYSTDPARIDHAGLRRLAGELEHELQAVPGTNRVEVVGGRPREVRVELRPDALAARRTAPLDVAFALGVSNVRRRVGRVEQENVSRVVEAGRFARSVADLETLVVNVVDGLPVYLRDVARVVDGPAEPDSATWIGFGPALAEVVSGGDAPAAGALLPAVHLAVAKRKGTDAVRVAEQVLARLDELRPRLLPAEVGIRVTRNYGVTAEEKVDELVESLAVAVLTVVLFIGVVLGWRAALVIALAIPVCYGATLLINLLAGYTINRVTLFALILALGLLVDDPITDVENIERAFRQRPRDPRRAVLDAIGEVRPALIMSTVAIILSFVPLFFITGMMGPYMAPMALNVPLAVVTSTVVAFCVTPFLALRALRGLIGGATGSGTGGAESPVDSPAAGCPSGLRYRLYDRLLRPLLRRRGLAWCFLAAVALLFGASLVLPALRVVPLKMLPFDNKNEFQLVVDLPEGSTLEQTDAVLREFAAFLLGVPEVEDVTTFAGVASPMDFNGMVRQYYLRRASELGEVRVQLAHKSRRSHQSHELVLRLRRELQAIAARHAAALSVVEVPPGPPVVATVTVEIYGEQETPYAQLEKAAAALAARLRAEIHVVDVDTSVAGPRQRLRFVPDQEKAALSGVAAEDVVNTAAILFEGVAATALEAPSEVDPLPVIVTLPRTLRARPSTLGTLQVKGRPGFVRERDGLEVRDAPQPLVPLGELGHIATLPRSPVITHKNLRPVAYVFAEVAGRAPAEVVLDVQADQVAAGTPLPAGAGGSAGGRPLAARSYADNGAGLPWQLPAGTRAEWTGEGEWKITLDVFRDLGIAFGAANVAIFIVLWIQTGSVVITLILMAAIPLTMIGIMPGFWLLNTVGERVVGGFPNPTFFTATAMIGMIALSGIVVRNSLVLVEFVHDALRRGTALEEALVRSGAIRVRPILLTAGTTLLGNVVIALDPVFSGLAWAIIFGIFASTVFSLGVVPVIYHLVYAHRPGHGLPPVPVQEGSSS